MKMYLQHTLKLNWSQIKKAQMATLRLTCPSRYKCSPLAFGYTAIPSFIMNGMGEGDRVSPRGSEDFTMARD
jgi:hypothetical protein